MKKSLVVMASLGLLSGLVCFVPSHGQERPGVAPPPAGVRIEAGPNGQFIRSFGGGGVGGSAQSEVGRIMSQLREATDDAKKAELTKKLETAVAKSFDEDMKARETELTKLEERLKKLKDQMERRRKAKADIIQLQLKVLANEAEGLGFSRTSAYDEGLSPHPIGVPALPGARFTAPQKE